MENLKNRINEFEKLLAEKDREMESWFEALGRRLNEQPELRKREDLESFITRLDLIEEENRTARELSRKIAHLVETRDELKSTVSEMEKEFKEDSRKKEEFYFELGKEAWLLFQKSSVEFDDVSSCFDELKESLYKRDELEKEMESAVQGGKNLWKKLVSGGRRTVISGKLKSLDHKRDDMLRRLGNELGENQKFMENGISFLGNSGPGFIEFLDSSVARKNEFKRKEKEIANLVTELESLCDIQKPSRKISLVEEEIQTRTLTEKGLFREIGEMYFMETRSEPDSIPEELHDDWANTDHLFQEQEKLKGELGRTVILKEIGELEKENCLLESKIEKKKQNIQDLQKEVRSLKKNIQDNQKSIEEKESRLDSVKPADAES